MLIVTYTLNNSMLFLFTKLPILAYEILTAHT